MKILGKYKNGNYSVIIGDDGTKIRETEYDDFIPEFAENCDCKITDKCDGGCKWCYEGCTPSGKHGNILDAKFLDSLHPFTELAINGNDLTHPDLIPFLQKLKEKKVIANITVNQKHFERNQDFIRNLVEKKLIWGLGVSLVEATPEFIQLIQQYPDAVIHTINGILSPVDIERLSYKGLKLLILGYKYLRRGAEWYDEDSEEIKSKQMWLKDHLEDVINRFKVVSFDNLALEQLDVRQLLSDEEWNEFYMGDDGNYTFYIDLVENKFSKNSIAPKEARFDLLDNVDDMFRVIREKAG